MTQTSDHKADMARRAAERDARRKAELKANMARRKDQVRARAADVQTRSDDAASDPTNEAK
jgi:hypothetical protein